MNADLVEENSPSLHGVLDILRTLQAFGPNSTWADERG